MAYKIKNDLELLAKEKNPEARSLLIRKLTAQYTRRVDDGPSEMERTLFSALVLDLYDQIDVGVRRDLVTLLARTSSISSALASRLSQEQDDVVCCLFEYSPMLSGPLLLGAVRTRGEAVLISIARRNEVPEELVDALMARAFISVAGELLRNAGASFSNNALLLCAILCQKSLNIQSLMAARCLVDQAFHDRLRRHVDTECPFLPSALAHATKHGTLAELAGKLQGDALEMGGNHLSRHEAVLQVNLGELSFDSLLATLISNRRKEDIVWFLKDAQGLSEKAMEHLLLTDGNKTLPRLLIEQQVSVKTYDALLHWRVDALDFPSRNLYRDVEDYRQKLRQKR
ncbi:DUF2336 domain-containing protein [Cohaesibacter celericrescens]|uniref:DUF2336 domain-containing protein n=1 Tax=Cohaesibacter celericrescens TaxID=2067669 RepID=A0A2N5XK39_9HYPH|nr:DUF2336 domain-containing protein [Cohaesibacter celericrescens]PLW74883.1 hypothetical protein C0081_21455 [Cohaesibacter celericrescens]